MKVLLINPSTKLEPTVRDMAGGLGFKAGEGLLLPPLDLAYLAASLRAKGNEVRIIDLEIEDPVNINGYDAYIVNVSLPALYRDCSFIKELKEKTSAAVIVRTGITYPLLIKEILERSKADFCIYGECDLRINEILERKDRSGTAYLNGAEIVVEPDYRIRNLNLLPFPARDLLQNNKYYYGLLGDRVTIMQTSRGCPYPCAYYCPYPLVQGNWWRERSAEHVFVEIEEVVNRHKIYRILFRDAVFTQNMARVHQIGDLIIASKLHLEWWCETRVDHLNSLLLYKMKEAGCRGINIGVETGDIEVLRSQAKVGLKGGEFKGIIKLCREIGIKVHLLFMVGLPKETISSFYETYKLVQELHPESMNVTFVTPYPGTPLYTEAVEKKWIESKSWQDYNGAIPVMHTDHFSRRDIFRAKKLIEIGFKLSKKRNFIYKIILRMLGLYFKRWAGK